MVFCIRREKLNILPMPPFQKVLIFPSLIQPYRIKTILGTMHLAYVLADKLGTVESINIDLQQDEHLILPEDIEKSGFLNISRVSLMSIRNEILHDNAYLVYERQWRKS